MLDYLGDVIHIRVYVTGAPEVVKYSGQIEHPVKCYKWGVWFGEGVLGFRATKSQSCREERGQSQD